MMRAGPTTQRQNRSERIRNFVRANSGGTELRNQTLFSDSDVCMGSREARESQRVCGGGEWQTYGAKNRLNKDSL